MLCSNLFHFVIKIFLQVISGAVRYVLEHQTVEGSFWEVTWLPDRKANATLQYPNDPIAQRNITLTAHVLIMLDTVKELPGVS
jgi:CD109 antigen